MDAPPPRAGWARVQPTSGTWAGLVQPSDPRWLVGLYALLDAGLVELWSDGQGGFRLHRVTGREGAGRPGRPLPPDRPRPPP